jgi:hypothetical protein
VLAYTWGLVEYAWRERLWSKQAVEDNCLAAMLKKLVRLVSTYTRSNSLGRARDDGSSDVGEDHGFPVQSAMDVAYESPSRDHAAESDVIDPLLLILSTRDFNSKFEDGMGCAL